MKHRRFMSMLLTMVMVLSMFASIPFTASAEIKAQARETFF